MIHSEVDCVTLCSFCMPGMQTSLTSTDIWASAQSCRRPGLSCRHHGHQRTCGQVCSPAKYDSHDSPEHVMTHEVQGDALPNKSYDSHDSTKGGSLKIITRTGYLKQAVGKLDRFISNEIMFSFAKTGQLFKIFIIISHLSYKTFDG